MRIPPAPHPWNVTPKEAVVLQRELADRVRRQALPALPRLVAGIDAAFTRDGGYCIAGVVLWDRSARRVLEQHVARHPLGFPYVPGLLSFREAPAVIEALRRLRRRPGALICDGQGVAHPRRFGLACHVGVIVGLPSVGCAKSRLIGEHDEPAERRGARRALRHDGEIVGTVLRTRDGVRPLYVSVGHRIDLQSAARLVLGCGAGYRLPEPTRLADRLVTESKRHRPEGG